MIYSVEDDQSIRDLVLYALRQSGYEAEGFVDGVAFRKALSVKLPDLVLMDQMLPGTDGETLLLELKKSPRTTDIPVIMLTAKGDEMDKVRALDYGADDYLVKPFGIMELLSRVRAVLRRIEPREKPHKILCGSVEMDLDRHTVFSYDQQITLTNKEFELLKCLMSSPEIVFTREKLLDIVWDIAYYGDTRTVDAHVRSLRQKLGESAVMIETIRGVGYRFSLTGAEEK